MIALFLRLFHLHRWTYTAPVYHNEKLAIIATPATRTCGACGKRQVRDEHCLGLNPPAYVHHWEDAR